jgi:hypothetical protein
VPGSDGLEGASTSAGAGVLGAVSVGVSGLTCGGLGSAANKRVVSPELQAVAKAATQTNESV